MSTSRRKKRGVLTGLIGLGLAGVLGAGLIPTLGDLASAATVEVDPSKDQVRAEKILNDSTTQMEQGPIASGPTSIQSQRRTSSP